MLISFSLISCEENQELDGVWVDRGHVLEFSKDTVSFMTSGASYLFTIKERQIILTQKLAEGKGGRWIYSTELPEIIGTLSEQGNSISNHFFVIGEGKSQLKKLTRSVSNSPIKKVQFTMHNGWDWGWNCELDLNGKSCFQARGYEEEGPTYIFQPKKYDLMKLNVLLSLVNIDSIKPLYTARCSDVPTYSFSLFTDEDTVHTHIRCAIEHSSLLPLHYFLEDYTNSCFKEAELYEKIDTRFFESELVECCFDTVCMINYHKKFDSLKYHLPEHNKGLLRILFDKYYDFENDNICYYLRSNENGTIESFHFRDPKIELDSVFLAELKTTLKMKPAVFNGKRIAIKDFDCISYLFD